MPFEERNGEVNMTLGYGKQNHPVTQEDFFHHGVDFATHRYILAAGSGRCGIGYRQHTHARAVSSDTLWQV